MVIPSGDTYVLSSKQHHPSPSSRGSAHSVVETDTADYRTRNPEELNGTPNVESILIPKEVWNTVAPRYKAVSSSVSRSLVYAERKKKTLDSYSRTIHSIATQVHHTNQSIAKFNCMNSRVRLWT
jgi:hypothetical protein